MLVILLDVEFTQCSIELMWDEYRQVDVTSLVDTLVRTNVVPWYVIWVGIVYEQKQGHVIRLVLVLRSIALS